MLGLDLCLAADGTLNILCIGAHSDDIEIGAGATLRGLARRYPQARVSWQVFSAGGGRADEARLSANYFVDGFAEADIGIHDFPDGFFPVHLAELKSRMEEVRKAVRPDVIFTHYRHDLHQDHRTLAELTWQTFRDEFILEFEIAKYDGDLGTPNFFCPVSAELRQAKLDALERYFSSQRPKGWFSAETFSALMRLRGVECRSPSGYAEAFYCRKAVLHGSGS